MKSLSTAPYRYYHKAIPKPVCEAIVEESQSLSLKDAVVYLEGTQQKDDSWRSSRIGWFATNSWIQRLIKSYVDEANEDAGWNYVLDDCEKVQFTEYHATTQDYYTWHRDFNISAEKSRKLSVTVQLSDRATYRGGDFEMRGFWDGKQVPIAENAKEQGTIFVFPALLQHQVTPVTSGVRHSLVQWYSGPDFV